MMYKCTCGSVFEEPLMIRERNHCGDGFFEELTIAVCPWCADGHFDEFDEEDEED